MSHTPQNKRCKICQFEEGHSQGCSKFKEIKPEDLKLSTPHLACACAESSCEVNCTKNHTHKTFSCKECKKELCLYPIHPRLGMNCGNEKPCKEHGYWKSELEKMNSKGKEINVCKMHGGHHYCEYKIRKGECDCVCDCTRYCEKCKILFKSRKGTTCPQCLGPWVLYTGQELKYGSDIPKEKSESWEEEFESFFRHDVMGRGEDQDGYSEEIEQVKEFISQEKSKSFREGEKEAFKTIPNPSYSQDMVDVLVSKSRDETLREVGEKIKAYKFQTYEVKNALFEGDRVVSTVDKKGDIVIKFADLLEALKSITK